VELTAEQIRVLGCLIEKEATTSDQYPLSSKALTVACNQKSSRDPVVDYPLSQVDDVMLDLRAEKLARTVHAAGQRTPKHKHVLDEAWGLSPPHLAVLAVLMLRGPNTISELRSRTERYIGFESDDDVAAALRSLSALDPPMTADVGRASGQRETRYVHCLGDVVTTSLDPTTLLGDDISPSGSPAGDAPSTTIDLLRAEVDELRAELAQLREQLSRLNDSLGEPTMDRSAP
jgi:uncharacterized protein YceH (UPF0502 family)